MLLGGIETQAVTELYGDFGSGKSQICYTLCAMAKQPTKEGGLDAGVIYIDTEGTFQDVDIDCCTILKIRGLDADDVGTSLKN